MYRRHFRTVAYVLPSQLTRVCTGKSDHPAARSLPRSQGPFPDIFQVRHKRTILYPGTLTRLCTDLHHQPRISTSYKIWRYIHRSISFCHILSSGKIVCKVLVHGNATTSHRRTYMYLDTRIPPHCQSFYCLVLIYCICASFCMENTLELLSQSFYR